MVGSDARTETEAPPADPSATPPRPHSEIAEQAKRGAGDELPRPLAPAQTEPPLTVIERQAGWALPNLRELWRYRELLFFLALRDVKVRYKQTVFGVGWAVAQPLMTMAVFALFLGKV